MPFCSILFHASIRIIILIFCSTWNIVFIQIIYWWTKQCLTEQQLIILQYFFKCMGVKRWVMKLFKALEQHRLTYDFILVQLVWKSIIIYIIYGLLVSVLLYIHSYTNTDKSTITRTYFYLRKIIFIYWYHYYQIIKQKYGFIFIYKKYFTG